MFAKDRWSICFDVRNPKAPVTQRSEGRGEISKEFFAFEIAIILIYFEKGNETGERKMRALSKNRGQMEKRSSMDCSSLLSSLV